jgi:FXSXX-COOH protein
MISTEERPEEVPPSLLVDLSDLPLAEISNLNAGILDEAIGRILPRSPSAPETAFNSAI